MVRRQAQRLLDSLPTCHLLIDRESRSVRYANAAAQQALGAECARVGMAAERLPCVPRLTAARLAMIAAQTPLGLRFMIADQAAAAALSLLAERPRSNTLVLSWFPPSNEDRTHRDLALMGRAVEGLDACVAVCSPDGTLRNANQAAEAVLTRCGLTRPL